MSYRVVNHRAHRLRLVAGKKTLQAKLNESRPIEFWGKLPFPNFMEGT